MRTIPEQYRGNYTQSNISGCTGNRSGHVFTSAGAKYDSDALKAKGLKNYSTPHDLIGTYYNLYADWNG